MVDCTLVLDINEMKAVMIKTTGWHKVRIISSDALFLITLGEVDEDSLITYTWEVESLYKLS